MAYDYDVDILAALWTGAEDAEEPYASILAANPALTDEVSELRILSTIELLRSHMELLQTRGEAKILHEAISKLIRHTAGGSNPWSEAAAVTSAEGNVKQPQFPAGASLDITYNGTTVSPVSATGGDLDTVIAELNAVLDAAVPGLVERRTTDTTGESVDSLSGKYFTLSSGDDVTDYYAWFDHAAQFERTNVVPVPDVGGSLGGTHFLINSAADATAYYVWMFHPGRAEVTNGSITGATVTALGAATYDFDVVIDGGAPQLLSITTVGGETYSAIAALMSAAVVGGTVVYDDPTFAFRFDSASATDPSSVLVAPGTAGSGGGDLFAALDAADSVTHVFTPPVTATDPAPGGTGIQVTYAIGDGPLGLASLIAGAAAGVGDFSGSFDAGGTAFLITAVGGPTTDSSDVDTGFSITTSQQGLPVAVDPAPGGLTGIPIFMSAGSSDAEIGSSMRADLGANPDFFTEGSGTSVMFDNTAAGPSTDAADVNTGLTITTTQQGSAAAGDAEPIQAYKTADGRLGFRGQTDFLTFSISNGTGGIIGPAGIIPGARRSKPAQVSDEGRDNATGHIVSSLERQGGL